MSQEVSDLDCAYLRVLYDSLADGPLALKRRFENINERVLILERDQAVWVGASRQLQRFQEHVERFLHLALSR